MVLFSRLVLSLTVTSNTWCWSVGTEFFADFVKISLLSWVNRLNWFCKFLNIKRLPVLLEGKTNFLWKSFMAAMRFFIYRFIQGGSRSSQVINSLGTKLDMIFIIVSLKTETYSLTSRLLSQDSQSNRLMDFFMWSKFAWEKCSFIRGRVKNLETEFSIN